MSSSTCFHRWTWWVHLTEGRLLSACRELKCSVGTEPVWMLTVSFYNQHTLFVLLLPCFHVSFVSVKLVQTHRGRLSQEMKAAWSLRTLCWIYILWCNWVWLEVVVCSCSRAQQLSEPSDKPALHWQTDDEQPANSRKQPALRPWMRRNETEAEKLQMRSDDGRFKVLYITD